MNWIGAIGGLELVLFKIVGFFIGAYVGFNNLYSMIAQFYVCNSEKKELFNDERPDENIQKIKLSNFQ